MRRTGRLAAKAILFDLWRKSLVGARGSSRRYRFKQRRKHLLRLEESRRSASIPRRKPLFRRRLAYLAATFLCIQQNSSPQAAATDVTRTTLSNGLRVVIIRNPLAPVVTVEQNYLVGGDETPSGFPGMAHAQEHMAFRGCSEVSADQISAILAQLGGNGNADTQQNITQYYSTIPAQDVEVALRLYAGCMQKVDDDQAEWVQERGAIEQEV